MTTTSCRGRGEEFVFGSSEVAGYGNLLDVVVSPPAATPKGPPVRDRRSPDASLGAAQSRP
jgi:hypothetical protein